MKSKLIGFGLGLLATASLAVLAQISGGGVEGGGGQPSGNPFATQYKNGNRFGGTGPGTSGQVLTSRGVGLSPTFQDAGGGGGSTVPTTTQGDTLFASATNVLSALAKNTSATRYLANTGTNNNPAWGQVNLANGVTGTLPVGNGGTGLASGTSGGVPYFSASNAITSSGALTSGGVVLGGGAGAAPNVSANLSFASTTLTLGDSTSGLMVGPAAATTTSAGSGVTVRGGPGGSTSGNGGTAALRGGIPVDGNGGIATVSGGNGVGTNRAGGDANIVGGSGTGTGTGGAFTLTGGTGGATGAGGGIDIVAGTGGATSGNGGALLLSAGGTNDGVGASVEVRAKDGVGTNRNGGNITLTFGNNTGSGVDGSLVLSGNTLTGAQTATFTATNKPGSGTTAPTLWFRIVVGATTYYVPMWQ